MTWDSWIVISPLVSGLVAALVTQAGAWWLQKDREQKQKTAAGSYLALRIATLLEEYAYNCVDVIYYNWNADEPPDEPFPSWKIQLPVLSEYPDDSDGWRAIPFDLASRVLELRNRIAETQGYIDSIAEYSTDDLSYELELKVGERGKEAWEIAAELRKRLSLSQANHVSQFPEVLEKAIKQGNASKAAREESSAALLQAASASSSNSTG